MRSANALPAQPPEGEAKCTFAGGALSSSQPTSFTALECTALEFTALEFTVDVIHVFAVI
jgi:hypothetical protein